MSALESIRDQVLAAAAGRRPLCVRGGGTRDFYGQSPAGDPLDTRGYAGIVSYEPTELVVSVRSGTLLSEVEAALHDKGQMLAFDPPVFAEGSTIGGVVASGLSGPRRVSAGAVRDFVLGASLMNARGEVLYFGGQVMKNVAGYDVSRLLCGSMGILGLITEVSLKVLPRPPADVTVGWSLGHAEVLDLLNRWAGQPLPIVATAWHEGDLGVRFAGAQAAVAAAVSQFERDYRAVAVPADQAASFWQRLRDQQLPYFRGELPLWRLSVPSTAAPLALEGATLIEWGGAQRWLQSNAAAAGIRAVAQQAGGTATLFRGGDKAAGVFHPLAAVNQRLHERLKHEFDPLGIFNPGRLYPGL